MVQQRFSGILMFTDLTGVISLICDDVTDKSAQQHLSDVARQRPFARDQEKAPHSRFQLHYDSVLAKVLTKTPLGLRVFGLALLYNHPQKLFQWVTGLQTSSFFLPPL